MAAFHQLIRLAFLCDQTRFLTFMIEFGLSGLVSFNSPNALILILSRRNGNPLLHAALFGNLGLFEASRLVLSRFHWLRPMRRRATMHAG